MKLQKELINIILYSYSKNDFLEQLYTYYLTFKGVDSNIMSNVYLSYSNLFEIPNWDFYKICLKYVDKVKKAIEIVKNSQKKNGVCARLTNILIMLGNCILQHIENVVLL
jgi:hypothetical protein